MIDNTEQCYHTLLFEQQGALNVFACIKCNCLYATPKQDEADEIAGKYKVLPA